MTQPFVDFSGKAHEKAIEAAKKAADVHPFSGIPVKPRRSAQEWEKARVEAATQKARRSAEIEALGKIKERRNLALQATLAELGSPLGKPGRRKARD